MTPAELTPPNQLCRTSSEGFVAFAVALVSARVRATVWISDATTWALGEGDLDAVRFMAVSMISPAISAASASANAALRSRKLHKIELEALRLDAPGVTWLVLDDDRGERSGCSVTGHNDADLVSS